MRPGELAQLHSLPLFRDMKAEHFASLLDAALLQQFPAGVVLIREGTQADFLYVLIDGLVEIFSEQDDRESGISLLKPVSTFILAAVVVEQTYLNSARTLAPSRILLIPAARVHAVFGQDAAFTRMIAKELALAYRGSVKKLKGYMARSTVERLANWILAEAPRDSGSVVLPFDRGTLASHIGTSRESLSRSLAALTEHGIRVRGREIIIADRSQLEGLAHPQRLIDDPGV